MTHTSSTIVPTELRIPSEKSKFRSVRWRTLEKYRKPIVLTLALMVRFLNAKATCETSRLGLFRIVGSSNQIQAATALQNHFLQRKGKPDIDICRQLMHALFDSLLRLAASLPAVRIACPTDQALVLMSLLGENRYITAHAVECICSGFQHAFRCILIHIARLQAAGAKNYQPWSPTLAPDAPANSNKTASHSPSPKPDSLENHDKVRSGNKGKSQLEQYVLEISEVPGIV